MPTGSTMDHVNQLKKRSDRKVLVTLGNGATGILNCGMANPTLFQKRGKWSEGRY